MALNPEQLFDEPVGNYGPLQKPVRAPAVTLERFMEVTGLPIEEAEAQLNSQWPSGEPEETDEEGLNTLHR